MVFFRLIWCAHNPSISLNRSQLIHAINETCSDSTSTKEESRAMSSAMSRELNAIAHQFDMTPEALAHLGDGRIAYVKAIRSEDVPTLFPQAPEIEPGVQLFALHAAD